MRSRDVVEILAVGRRHPLSADEVAIALLEGHLHRKMLLFEFGHHCTPCRKGDDRQLQKPCQH
jgi:hypothetical protein